MTEVVAALPLSTAARAFLADVLGPGFHLVDIRESGTDADIVLAPPCSAHAIGALKRSFPSARVVVVELEDWLLGIDVRGPVRRSIDAGAAAYYVAPSAEALGHFLQSLPASPVAAIDRSPVELPVAATVDELVVRHAEEAVARRRR